MVQEIASSILLHGGLQLRLGDLSLTGRIISSASQAIPSAVFTFPSASRVFNVGADGKVLTADGIDCLAEDYLSNSTTFLHFFLHTFKNPCFLYFVLLLLLLLLLRFLKFTYSRNHICTWACYGLY